MHLFLHDNLHVFIDEYKWISAEGTVNFLPSLTPPFSLLARKRQPLVTPYLFSREEELVSRYQLTTFVLRELVNREFITPDLEVSIYVTNDDK